MAATRSVKAVFTAVDKISPVLGRIGIGLGAVGAIAGITGGVALGRKLVGGFKDAVAASQDFQQEMSAVRAIASATPAEFAKLEKAAKQMGVTTVFSATQAAQAERQLAQAGLKTTDIITALPQVLKLAAAGEIELGEAARTAASITKAMNLEFTDLSDTVDILAFTANNANATMQELGEAMKYVAGSADIIGASLPELSAALGALHDRGMQASRAGAALNAAFATLGGAPLEQGQAGLKGFTVELLNADGSSKGLVGTIQALADAGVTGKDAMTIFGKRSGLAMKFLLDIGAPALQEMVDKSKAVRKEFESVGGYAADVMAKKLDNLSGDVTLLQSAWEGLKIAVGDDATPVLRDVVQVMTVLTQEMAGAAENTNAFGSALASVVSSASQLAEGTAFVFRTLILEFEMLRSAYIKGAAQFSLTAGALLTSISAQGSYGHDLGKNLLFIGTEFVKSAEAIDEAAGETAAGFLAFEEAMDKIQAKAAGFKLDLKPGAMLLPIPGSKADLAQGPPTGAGPSSGKPGADAVAAVKAIEAQIAAEKKAATERKKIADKLAGDLEQLGILTQAAATQQGVAWESIATAAVGAGVPLITFLEKAGQEIIDFKAEAVAAGLVVSENIAKIGDMAEAALLARGIMASPLATPDGATSASTGELLAGAGSLPQSPPDAMGVDPAVLAAAIAQGDELVSIEAGYLRLLNEMRLASMVGGSEEASDLRLEMLLTAQAAELEAARAHGANLTNLEAAQAQERANFYEAESKAKIKAALMTASAISSSLASTFGNSKAAALASSIINTAAAVVEALPNIPLSIVIAALGAVQLAKIQSTDYSGFAQGGIIPGVDLGRDSEHIMARPGEAVLPVPLVKEIRRLAGAPQLSSVDISRNESAVSQRGPSAINTVSRRTFQQSPESAAFGESSGGGLTIEGDVTIKFDRPPANLEDFAEMFRESVRLEVL